MKLSLSLSIAFAAITAYASPINPTIRAVDALSGPVSGMIWTGPVVPGGPNVTLSGTAESIYNQILTMNPDYTPKDSYNARNGSSSALALRKREKDGIICNIPGKLKGGANLQRMYEQIYYLENVGAMCGVQARTCARISCSWGAAIHLCNDNDYHIERDCWWLAGFAYDILDQCAIVIDDIDDVGSVNGQEFDTDHYNIVLSTSNC